jgi:hypothetical protein
LRSKTAEAGVAIFAFYSPKVALADENVNWPTG